MSHRAAAAAGALVGAALLAIAFANGVYEITFGSRVPAIRDTLGFGVGDIGLVASGFPAGLLFGAVAMILVGKRWGTRACIAVGAVLFFAPMVGMGVLIRYAPSAATVTNLWLLWAVSGFGCGLLDPAHGVVVNSYREGVRFGQLAQAVKLGGLVIGSLAATLAIAVELSAADHLLVVGTATLAIGLLAAVLIPNVGGREPTVSSGPEIGRRGLARLALMLIASVVPLGGVIVWGTSMLEELGAPGALMGVGLIGFAVFQVVGMLTVFAAAPRVRPERFAVAGVALAVAGLALLTIVAAHLVLPFLSPAAVIPITVAGLALLALGIAPLPGLVQRTATNVSVGAMSVTTRVGSIVAVQYAVQGAAPALVGWVADVTGVMLAFVLVAGVCVLLLPAGAGLLRHAVIDHLSHVPTHIACAAAWWGGRLRDSQGLTPDAVTRFERALADELVKLWERYGRVRQLSLVTAGNPLGEAARAAEITVDGLIPRGVVMRISRDGTVTVKGPHSRARRRIRRW